MKTFTDISAFWSEQRGEPISVEEMVTPEQNVFAENGFSTEYDNGQRLLLRFALKTLTKRQQEVVHCVYFDGMTHDQAASKIGIPRQTVGFHLAAAMAKLRKVCLGD